MIKLERLILRNFISCGAINQVIDFENQELSLILGENLDQGSNSSRNGVGKTTIINGISYALYGNAITNIKKDNLINKTNGKDMFVSISFSKGNNTYRIERGRRPNFVKFFVNDGLVNDPESDEAQGESKYTQEEIQKVVNLSHTLFKHIVALNTYTQPFLSMRPGDQKPVIEELLGITILSQKAEHLAEMKKETKSQIQKEEYRIKGIKDANDNINKMIDRAREKSEKWKVRNQKEIEELESALDKLNKIDIEEEIKTHENLADYNQLHTAKQQLIKEEKRLEKSILDRNKRLQKLESDVNSAKENTCPTCGQDMSNHQSIIDNLNKQINELYDEIESYANELENTQTSLKETQELLDTFDKKPEPFYDSIDQAYNHRSTFEQLTNDLEKKRIEENPEEENIKNLENSGLQEISYENMNQLIDERDHQEFLYKLLTNKDSFIRKKIIDQNLHYLNKQLNNYLEKLSLPHEVIFQNDMSAEITELGRDLDFDNLSRGEKNRLILGLSWAFRDIWENLNEEINVMFIDEMIDSGMDLQGVESALEILKNVTRDGARSVYLISHREELMSRVNNVLLVQKENGFTNFVSDYDYD